MQALKMQWRQDPNGGGFTGSVPGNWIAYVLNNGTWTLYRSGELKYFATGSAPSVNTARIEVSKLVQPHK